MQTIIDFFSGMYEVVIGLVDFVIGIVTDLVYVVELLGAFVVKLPVYFSWLPNAVVTLIVSIFAIVVIYKILGREG